MQIDTLAVALRNRSNMEAIDLGFALARKWFLRLWCAWLIGALPLFLITVPITLFVDPLIASLIFILFWWLKPLYEQPVLYILSRQLFSEPITLKYIFKNYFQIIKPQLAALLFWRRLSLSRSFNNPVAMLEGLTGKERRARLNVLHSQQTNSSQLLTFICVNLELLLYLSILAFLYMLVPTELIEIDFLSILESENVLLNLLINLSYFIAISIIAPFYVASGFSLYITRRTKLEGWDIELAFKRMNNRLSNINLTNKLAGNAQLACIAVALCIVIHLVIPAPVYAENDVDTTIKLNQNNTVTLESSKQTIQNVLEHDDFGKVTKKKEWVYIGYTEEDPDEPPEWLEDFFKWLFGDFSNDKNSVGLQIFEILIWISIAILIFWLLRKYSNWMQWINTESKLKNRDNKSAPHKIMGLDITQESLPKDILHSVNELLNQKRYREALSLLYRASLSKIIQRGDIEIQGSATEQECNQLVTQSRDSKEANYFSTLTRTWILLAYGDRTPSKDTLSHLLDNWGIFYGTRHE